MNDKPINKNNGKQKEPFSKTRTILSAKRCIKGSATFYKIYSTSCEIVK